MFPYSRDLFIFSCYSERKGKRERDIYTCIYCFLLNFTWCILILFPQQNSEAMISIDMPAGPSEVLVIADKHASPVHIAADLLSQVFA